MADVGERRTINGQLAEWDGQGWLPVTGPSDAPKRTWTDTAVDALPMAGGALGGLVGGIGGTVGGFGVGGVPGAMGGAALGGAAGEAGRQLVNRARGQAAPPTMGAAALDIGKEGAIQGAMEGAGQAVMPIVGSVARQAYRGYLKPSLARVNLPKAAQIVKDAIAESIPVTQGGLQRADALIDELHGKVNALLSQATGKTVDLVDMARQVRTWATRMYDRPGRDPRDLKAALAVADRIDQTTSVAPGRAALGDQMASFIDDVPPSPPSAAYGKQPSVRRPTEPTSVDMLTANQVKRDMQRAAGDKFGVPTGSAETATEKRASATLRRGIEAQVPEVGPLNARQSRLIDVAKAIARATGRESNKSPLIGVNTLVAGTVGGAEYGRTGDPVSAAAKALALRIGLAPAVATRAAIVAAKLAEKIPGTAVADVARVAVQVVSESQEEP